MNTKKEQNKKTHSEKIKEQRQKRREEDKKFQKKEDLFCEIQANEEERIKSAQYNLFSRLDDDDKTDAYRWVHIYDRLLGEKSSD